MRTTTQNLLKYISYDPRSSGVIRYVTSQKSEILIYYSAEP